MAIDFTITDLKKYLGPGLGLRKNKYLIEIPVGVGDGRQLNILCRSAGLPERNISTTNVFHRGRKYQVRGETDYGGTYEVSIVDDSNMEIRKLFDKWLMNVDHSKPKHIDSSSASYEVDSPDGFNLTIIDNTIGITSASYQTDINIWQLGNNITKGEHQKVYGYKLQNAFPSQVGIVTLDDGDENTLSEFSITFSFSEFIPIQGVVLGDDIPSEGVSISTGIESTTE